MIHNYIIIWAPSQAPPHPEIEIETQKVHQHLTTNYFCLVLHPFDVCRARLLIQFNVFWMVAGCLRILALIMRNIVWLQYLLPALPCLPLQYHNNALSSTSIVLSSNIYREFLAIVQLKLYLSYFETATVD